MTTQTATYNPEAEAVTNAFERVGAYLNASSACYAKGDLEGARYNARMAARFSDALAEVIATLAAL